MNEQEIEIFIDETQKLWFQSRLLEWSLLNLREFPWRDTNEPYKIFVAEFLLQQTDAPRVVPIYQQFLEKYPNLERLANASPSDIAAILKPLGFHYRANRLVQSAQLIIKDTAYKGILFKDETKLLQLPGVGRYIARSVCANAFGQPLAVLDTNISRIIQRFFGLKPCRSRVRDDPFFWQVVQYIAPHSNVGRWNLTLVDFGSMVCTYRHPHCITCPLSQRCQHKVSKK